MKIAPKTMEELTSNPIKSKVKFSGDFKLELEKIILKCEELIRKEIISTYGVIYTEFDNYTVKVKIDDKNLMAEKLITCNFYYDRNDEKYGYIWPQFISSEKGQKNKKYNLGQFKISDTEKVANIFIKSMIEIIEEY